jgi:hypothetical protein
MANAEKLFFIVGRGRSGTTLLLQFLDAHPDVAMAPEALFVVGLLRKYRRATWDEGTIQRFCRDLRRERDLERWRLDFEAIARDAASAATNSYAEMCARVYAACAASRGRRNPARLGDKNPLYSLFIPTLAALYPSARFIHIVRDYRDNVLSYQHVPFDVSTPSTLAMRWRLYNEAVLDAAARYPDRFLRVRFEDLIADPEHVLSGICKFLGVEWTASMLSERGIPYFGLADWHQRLAGPLDPGQAGKWRARLAREDVEAADRICQPLGAALGYPPAFAQPARGTLATRAGEVAGRVMTAAEKATMSMPWTLRTGAIRMYMRAARARTDSLR